METPPSVIIIVGLSVCNIFIHSKNTSLKNVSAEQLPNEATYLILTSQLLIPIS